MLSPAAAASTDIHDAGGKYDVEEQKFGFTYGNEVESENEERSTAQKVRYILADEDDDKAVIELGKHPLFTQMDVLCHFDDGRMGWKEVSRWLKYEETVEVGDRWSKPFVSITRMDALKELKKSLVDGLCAVGFGDPSTGEQNKVADAVVRAIKQGGNLSDDACRKVRDVLLVPHKHKDRKADKKYESNDSRQRESHKLLRRRSGEGSDLGASLYKYPPGATPTNLAPYKANKKLTKKLPKSCEAASILVGQVDFLKERVVAFCRIDPPAKKADLVEVAAPTRFVFLILSPSQAPANCIWEISEVGRSVASLLADKVFCEVAYKAKSRQDLIDGIDEYIDGLSVLPPSVWDPATRLEPQRKTISPEKVVLRLEESTRGPAGPVAEPQEEGAASDETLERTKKFCGGLIRDIKNRYRLYLSDITDGLSLQCIASTVFLFFACITPIVTFGGLMGQKTDGYMGTIEMLLAGAICGTIYALFAGQPLTIIGATGPLLVFESIIYHLSHENKIDFMGFRFWIGLWVMVFLFIIVAFDLSFLVRYITRFTEEAFSILISVIFIYEAFAKVFETFFKRPVHYGVVRQIPTMPWLYQCHCTPVLPPIVRNITGTANMTAVANAVLAQTNVSSAAAMNAAMSWTLKFNENCVTFRNRIAVKIGCITEQACVQRGWNLTGPACYQYQITRAIPDAFFFSIILFFGTFALAYALRSFRTSRYFPSIVRNTVADFAVFLSVLVWTLVDYGFGLYTIKLNVPSEFKPTRADRGWVVNPGAVMPHWYLILLAAIPALLATILIFLDQQITAVIVNRKEHKLKKPHGYHLDLFVVAVSIFICSLLGLPWFVAATVRSITHVRSLMVESEVKIPGEKPQLIGAREQRVTGFFIHLLIGLSTLLTKILGLIPMPVLYGVFLYMGITSLAGVQFIERIAILFMPVKYQPDYIFLRHVRTIRVHFFTVIQLACFIGMWVVKQIKITSIAFPLMLVALMAVRKLLDFIFTQTELYWLDHLFPEEERRKKEDEARRQEMRPESQNRDSRYAKETDAFLRQ